MELVSYPSYLGTGNLDLQVWFQHLDQEELFIVPGEIESRRWFSKDVEFDKAGVQVSVQLHFFPTERRVQSKLEFHYRARLYDTDLNIAFGSSSH